MQTSWQSTSMAEDLNAGLPLTNPARGQGGTWILEFGASDHKSGALTTRPRCLHNVSEFLSTLALLC